MNKPVNNANLGAYTIIQPPAKAEKDKFTNESKWYKHFLKEGAQDPRTMDEMRTFFLSLAQENNYAPAQYMMGVASKRAEGVLESDREALKWLEKSIDGGFFPALSYLGLLYEKGAYIEIDKAIEQDYQKAVELYSGAAKKGDPHGQLRLGLMYAEGKGVPRSAIHAYAWISTALANGYQGGKDELETLKSKLENLKGEAGFNLARAEEKAADIWESIDRNFVKELDEKFGIESRHVMR